MLNFFSPTEIKNLLNKYSIRPSKALGQNFLIDRNVLSKIIKTSDLKPDDTVLEIGPGIGTLTQELAKNAGKIIAIEKDQTMCKILSETLADCKNIEIIQGDVLKIFNSQFSIFNKFPNFQFSNYKVIANIPYYLTSNLIRNLLENKNPPKEIILLIQKEVAQRICASPPNMSLLAVSVQFYAKPEIISYVSKNCFWPSPKVDSAIIKITPKTPGVDEKTPGVERDIFFKIVKAGFSHPRKQLAGNLLALSRAEGSKELTKKEINSWLKKNNLDPTQRAETLSVADWRRLAGSL